MMMDGRNGMDLNYNKIRDHSTMTINPLLFYRTHLFSHILPF